MPSSQSKLVSSYGQNISYEIYAPRTIDQVSSLSRIASLTAGPTAGIEKNDNGHALKKENEYADIKNGMSPLVSSASSFRFSNKNDGIDIRSVSLDTLEKANQKSDYLTRLIKHTNSIKLALRASINIAEDISTRHAELVRKSGELSSAADRLQGEQELLSRHAEEIGRPIETHPISSSIIASVSLMFYPGMPLKHYDAVDAIGILVGVLFKGDATVRGLAKIKVDDENFPAILDRINGAVDFFARESGGEEAVETELRQQHYTKNQGEIRGSVEYYRRSIALQDAALYLIREAVVDRILTTTIQISNALNIPKVPIAADKLEASLVYTRFHGISSRSNRLLALLRKRLHRGEVYFKLLDLCRTAYCNSRSSLLKPTIRAHMDKLKEQHGLIGMTRLASVFLIRLCTVETALYLEFFGDKKAVVENPNEYTKLIDDEENHTLTTGRGKTRSVSVGRPCSERDFQAYLSSLSSGLNNTVRRGIVSLSDLDILCQIVSVLREERSMASSSPTTLAAARVISSVIEDVQERLIFCATNSLAKEVIRFKPTPNDLDYPNKLKRSSGLSATESPSDSNCDPVQMQLQVYESWFPPMRSVLRILSKIFRVVEPKVFEDIALQSVQSCTRSLNDGSKQIQKRSGTIHADLFLVKHLLILREQLSPFDIDLRSVERQLDFSDAGKAVSRFLANRNRRLFSMSTENALVTLLREGLSINEESVDSKKDLESALKKSCNEFIDHSCDYIAKDLKILAANIEKISIESIFTAPFFNVNEIQEALSKTSKNLVPKTKDIVDQMTLYLENPTTQTILLKPISRKIMKLLDAIRNAVMLVNDVNCGWDVTRKSQVIGNIDEIEKNIKKIGRSPE